MTHYNTALSEPSWGHNKVGLKLLSKNCTCLGEIHLALLKRTNKTLTVFCPEGQQ